MWKIAKKYKRGDILFMHINTNNGKSMFDTKGELYYHLLLEMGLGLDRNNHIYDQTSGDTLSWKDKYIKCATNDQPIYAGKDEVIFSIDENFQLFMNVFAHFLENLSNDEDSDIVVVAHYTEFDELQNKSRLMVKYDRKDGSVIGAVMGTSYYSDTWLCYIEAIFLLNGNNGFDLSNFDQEREKR